MERKEEMQVGKGQRLKLPLRSQERFGEVDTAERIRAYWRLIQQRRWSVISGVSLVFVVALFWTLKQKPIYEGTALLEIGNDNPEVVSLQQSIPVENQAEDSIETQYKLLQSDSLARTVARKLNLDKVREFNSGTTTPKSEEDEQRVLKLFAEKLNVIPIAGSRLVRVTFDSQDPKLAAAAVNTIAETYIEQNLQNHWEAAQKAAAWLGKQLDEIKIKLEKSEDELQQYAQTNGLLFLEDSNGGSQSVIDRRLQQLQDELTQTQAERFQRESVFRLAEAGDYGALPGVFDSKVTQDLSERLGDLQEQQAQMAPQFKSGYPRMKQIQSEIDRTRQLLKQQRAEAERNIADQYFAAAHRENLVKQALVKQQRQAYITAEKTVQYAILKREVDTNKQLYNGLLQKMKEAGVTAGLRASNIRVVDPAVPPSKPVRPQIAFDLTVGLLLGLVSGTGLACLRERLDSTIKSPDDVARFLHLPILGLIPKQHGTARRRLRTPRLAASPFSRPIPNPMTKLEPNCSSWIRIDGGAKQFSDLREAFRVLRTSILLSRAGRPPRLLAFVSADAGEGKTTVCCNLAVSLAQLGKKVLIIDADIRRPSVQNFFNISGSSGLVNYLAGQSDWRTLVQVSNTRGLDCLICGPEPPNPGELLSSERMDTLIKDAMNDYNFVLVDAPPLLSITDGRILAAVVEGAVLVIKGGVSSRERVRRAQSCATAVGARVIGVVLNQMKLCSADYYQTGYYEREAVLSEVERVSA